MMCSQRELLLMNTFKSFFILAAVATGCTGSQPEDCTGHDATVPDVIDPITEPARVHVVQRTLLSADAGAPDASVLAASAEFPVDPASADVVLDHPYYLGVLAGGCRVQSISRPVHMASAGAIHVGAGNGVFDIAPDCVHLGCLYYGQQPALVAPGTMVNIVADGSSYPAFQASAPMPGYIHVDEPIVSAAGIVPLTSTPLHVRWHGDCDDTVVVRLEATRVEGNWPLIRVECFAPGSLHETSVPSDMLNSLVLSALPPGAPISISIGTISMTAGNPAGAQTPFELVVERTALQATAALSY